MAVEWVSADPLASHITAEQPSWKPLDPLASSITSEQPAWKPVDVLASKIATIEAAPSPLVTYGFPTENIADFFGLDWLTAHSTQKVVLGESLGSGDVARLSTLSPERIENIRGGYEHLSQHPMGSHYHGDFNPIQAVERFFTINPQSFTFANLARDLSAGTQTILTGGLAKLFPQVNSEPIFSTSAKEPSIAGSALVGANTFGTVTASPTGQESLLDKVARITGGAVSALAVGKVGSDALTTSYKSQIAAGGPDVYGPPKPLTYTQQAGNLLGGATLQSSKVFGFGQIAQAIVGLFGKIGQAALQIFSGDVKGAIDTLTRPGPGPGQLPSPVSPGVIRDRVITLPSGGGGGGGFFPGSVTASTLSPGVVIGLGVATVVLLFLILKKKG